MIPAAAANRWLPFLAWWPNVGRDTLRDDATAALTGAMIVLPQAVAFATIAGLPPQYGLYAAMMPAVMIASAGMIAPATHAAARDGLHRRMTTWLSGAGCESP